MLMQKIVLFTRKNWLVILIYFIVVQIDLMCFINFVSFRDQTKHTFEEYIELS